MVLARYFGGNEHDHFYKAVYLSIFLSFFTTIAITVFSLLFLKPLLILLHNSADILNISQSYISVIMLFCCVAFAYNLLSSMLRAIGKSYVPLYALMIASVLNVILDIFLVKGLNIGLKGAAFGTVIAQGFSVLFLTNVGSVILQGSINSFGTATITGHTAARKFHELCMLPLGTIRTSSATFVSQNYGA